MSAWYEGTNDVGCDMDHVRESLLDLGGHFVGVVRHMPGLTTVDLVDQTDDSVTITTNEGTMTRTNISTRIEADRVVVEFDEQYQAGSRVTTNSHFTEDFTTAGNGVTHRLEISDVSAPGMLGFLYRTFGSAKIGKALLEATASHLERSTS